MRHLDFDSERIVIIHILHFSVEILGLEGTRARHERIVTVALRRNWCGQRLQRCAGLAL